MFRNDIKIALRNIKRHKVFSLINILGFAIGMACFLLIFLWAKDQFSYDGFHEKKDQIFRLQRGKNNVAYTSRNPAPLGPALTNTFPEIVDYVRIQDMAVSVRYEDKSFIERAFFLCDPSFFKVFTFPLTQGNPETVLKEPSSVVITQRIAEKYFDNEDPIGKTITVDDKFDFKITGIAENAPLNTHLNYEFIAPFEQINAFAGVDYLNAWRAYNFINYVLLQKSAQVSEVKNKIIDFLRQQIDEDEQDLYLQPITRINLETYNKIVYIILFTTLAIFILLLACINFTNLSIAQSLTRAREVGIRKAVGASRHQLIKQFLGESLFISLVALPLAIALIELVLPSFNNLSMSQIKINYFQSWSYLLIFLSATLIVGLLSGCYPALYVSGLRPVHSLKGELQAGYKRSVFRNILIVFQFTVSVFLIIGTLIIYRQLNYMKKQELGFNQENIIAIPLYYSDTAKEQVKNIKNELLPNPNVISACVSNFMYGGGHYNNSIWYEGMPEKEKRIWSWISVDPDFLKTFHVELVAGRNFSQAIQSDVEKAYILNESAVRELAWETPVGKQFQIIKGDTSRGTVIGVIKDFNFRSLRYKVDPLVLTIDPEFFSYLSVRVQPGHLPDGLKFIEDSYKKFAPLAAFQYFFPEELFNQIYTGEHKINQLFNALSVIAIFLACLGLLGLSSSTTTQRTKEVGIRKVLGASVSKIIFLLSREFVKLVLLANIIAWPLAYLAMNKWLQSFSYRINISILLFIIAGLSTLLAAFFTISFKAFKAATANPVDALRYE